MTQTIDSLQNKNNSTKKRRRRRKRLPDGEFNTIIEENLSHDGRGIAKINGKTHFILNSLPNEEVEFKSYKINATDDHNFLFVKTPFMMKGYLNDLPYSRKCEIDLDFEGFFNTQDIADYKNNKIIIKGRRKDLIKKAGEIISLSYLENTTYKIDNIKEVACIGIDDEFAGSKIIMFVVFDQIDDLNNSIYNLIKKLNSKLKKIEIPDKILPIPIMPKTETGKILKQIIKNIYLKNN